MTIRIAEILRSFNNKVIIFSKIFSKKTYTTVTTGNMFGSVIANRFGAIIGGGYGGHNTSKD